MTQSELNGIWNYYLSLENDLANTSRYIEPSGQENVYSFEFAKLLILSCTEIESIFKIICYEIEGHQVRGDIAAYKEAILKKFPKIVHATVSASRLGRDIEPFSAWVDGKLPWWNAYQRVKHDRGNCFSEATYINAATAIAAVYILVFYLAKITNLEFYGIGSKYFFSNYCYPTLRVQPSRQLPDFEE